MKRTYVTYIFDWGDYGMAYSTLLKNEMLTGRYKEKNGEMFIEIEEPHHFLWLYHWTTKRWIPESLIKFHEEEIFDCKETA